MLNRFLDIAAIFVCLILFVGAPLFPAYGQLSNEELVGSSTVYSKLGVGFPVDLGSSSAEGMSLSGVSFIEPNVPGLANPAQWGSTVYGMATGGVSVESFKAKDGQASSTSSLFSANYFQFQFPVKRDKFGLSASLTPYTRSSFSFTESGSRIIDSGGIQDTLNYVSELNGSGGINRLELGFGWKITPNFSIGYAGSLIFASIDNEYSTNFDSGFIPVSLTRQTSGLGFGNRFGAMFNTPNLLRQGDQLSLGASVTLPVSLDGERIEQADKVLPNGTVGSIVIEEGEGLGSGSIDLPMTVKGGITYQPSRLLSVSTEALYQDLSLIHI